MVTRMDVDGYLHVVEGGEYMYFEDHQREVAQLQARVAELEAARAHLREALEDIASGEITRSHCTGPHCVEELGVATADEMASRAAGALDWDARA